MFGRDVMFAFEEKVIASMSTVQSDIFYGWDAVSLRIPSDMNHWIDVDLTALNGWHASLSLLWFPINMVQFEGSRV